MSLSKVLVLSTALFNLRMVTAQYNGGYYYTNTFSSAGIGGLVCRELFPPYYL